MPAMFPVNEAGGSLAANKSRIEVKYLFPLEKMDRLLAYIRPFMKSDEHSSGLNGRGSYTVGSVYFDTPSMEHYWTHLEGYPHRRKVRIRRYGSPEQGAYFWEIKEKAILSAVKYRWVLNPAFIGKLSSCVNEKQMYDLLNEYFPSENEQGLCRKMGFDLLKGPLKPVAYVSFKRMAFKSLGLSDVRLTVDYAIEASRSAYPFYCGHRGKPKTIIDHEAGVLELKFSDRIPSWFEDVLLAFDLRRTAFSKYRHAAEILYKLD
jgi:hypothetical protein